MAIGVSRRVKSAQCLSKSLGCDILLELVDFLPKLGVF